MTNMVDETKTADQATETTDAGTEPAKGSAPTGGTQRTSPPLPSGTTAPALVPRKPPEKAKSSMLACFGGVLVLAALFHLVLFIWPKFIEPTQNALTISIAVAVVALAASKLVWPAWLFVGHKIGRTFTIVVVSILYFFFLPFFQFLRSGDPLGKRLGEAASYWEQRDETKQDPDVEKVALPF